MEWVIAALAMGCAFFTFQVVVDYVKHRSVVGPRMQQLAEARAELERRLQAAQGELEQRRGELDPLHGEVAQLEQQAADLERSIESERVKQRPELPVRRRRNPGSPSDQA
jgi:predicted nuclease with TOPRIM domain